MRLKRAQRIIAFLLVVTFAASEASYAAPFTSVSAPADSSVSLAADPSRFEAPLDWTTLQEIHKGNSKKLIIHVQDAHANLSGQENLASALDFLMSKYGVELVLSEGGVEDCSLTALKKIATPETWKRVAKKHLVMGNITGEEYLNLVSDHPMKIVGLEDMSLYMKSVQSYAELADKREEIITYLKTIRRSLDKLKQRSYPADILDYERITAGAGSDFESRFRKLFEIAASHEIAVDEFSNLEKLVELSLKEKLIDFNLANLERAALLEEIAQKGGQADIEKAMEAFNRTKNAKVSQFVLFNKTLNIAKEKQILTTKYPNFLKYGEYLEFFSELDLEAVLSELDKAEDKVYAAVLSEGDPRLLHSIDRYLRLLVTAYGIQMTTKEFNLFRVNEPDFATRTYLSFVNKKLLERGYFEDVLPYKDVLEEGKKSLEAFYDAVSQRDYAFIQNTEKALASENQEVAVLITGGYHTSHLKELFKEKGYSYAVLTPIVTTETNQAKYEKLLLEPVKKDAKKLDVVNGRFEKSVARGQKARQLALMDSGARLAVVVGDVVPADQVQQVIARVSRRPDAVKPGPAAKNRIAITRTDVAALRPPKLSLYPEPSVFAKAGSSPLGARLASLADVIAPDEELGHGAMTVAFRLPDMAGQSRPQVLVVPFTPLERALVVQGSEADTRFTKARTKVQQASFDMRNGKVTPPSTSVSEYLGVLLWNSEGPEAYQSLKMSQLLEISSTMLTYVQFMLQRLIYERTNNSATLRGNFPYMNTRMMEENGLGQHGTLDVNIQLLMAEIGAHAQAMRIEWYKAYVRSKAELTPEEQSDFSKVTDERLEPYLNDEERQQLQELGQGLADRLTQFRSVADDLKPYLIQDRFPDGQDMDSYIRTAGQTADMTERARIADSILGSLHELHKQGVIHRDIKPGNIWIPSQSEQSPMIVDFGLAKIDLKKSVYRLSEEDRWLVELTSSYDDGTAGTAGYIPSVFDRRNADYVQNYMESSYRDIYAMGVTLGQLYGVNLTSYEFNFGDEAEIRPELERRQRTLDDEISASQAPDYIKEVLRAMIRIDLREIEKWENENKSNILVWARSKIEQGAQAAKSPQGARLAAPLGSSVVNLFAPYEQSGAPDVSADRTQFGAGVIIDLPALEIQRIRQSVRDLISQANRSSTQKIIRLLESLNVHVSLSLQNLERNMATERKSGRLDALVRMGALYWNLKKISQWVNTAERELSDNKSIAPILRDLEEKISALENQTVRKISPLGQGGMTRVTQVGLANGQNAAHLVPKVAGEIVMPDGTTMQASSFSELKALRDNYLSTRLLSADELDELDAVIRGHAYRIIDTAVRFLSYIEVMEYLKRQAKDSPDAHLAVMLSATSREDRAEIMSRAKLLQRALTVNGAVPSALNDENAIYLDSLMKNEEIYMNQKLFQNIFRSGREGVDLATAIGVHRGSWDARQKAELIQKIAQGIDLYTRAGIVHRDLKPSNIWVDVDLNDYSVKEVIIYDFGLASFSENTAGQNVRQREAAQMPATVATRDLERQQGFGVGTLGFQPLVDVANMSISNMPQRDDLALRFIAFEIAIGSANWTHVNSQWGLVDIRLLREIQSEIDDAFELFATPKFQAGLQGLFDMETHPSGVPDFMSLPKNFSATLRAIDDLVVAAKEDMASGARLSQAEKLEALDKEIAELESKIVAPHSVMPPGFTQMDAIKGAVRILAVPDIHGDIRALVYFLKKAGFLGGTVYSQIADVPSQEIKDILARPEDFIRFRKGDVVVFLGDLVDTHLPAGSPGLTKDREKIYGSSAPNLDVLKLIHQMKKMAPSKGALVKTVLGNHDEMVRRLLEAIAANPTMDDAELRKSIENLTVMANWARGWESDLEATVKELRQAYLDPGDPWLRELLSDLKYVVNVDNVVFTHAGILPGKFNDLKEMDAELQHMLSSPTTVGDTFNVISYASEWLSHNVDKRREQRTAVFNWFRAIQGYSNSVPMKLMVGHDPRAKRIVKGATYTGESGAPEDNMVYRLDGGLSQYYRQTSAPGLVMIDQARGESIQINEAAAIFLDENEKAVHEIAEKLYKLRLERQILALPLEEAEILRQTVEYATGRDRFLYIYSAVDNQFPEENELWSHAAERYKREFLKNKIEPKIDEIKKLIGKGESYSADDFRVAAEKRKASLADEYKQMVSAGNTLWFELDEEAQEYDWATRLVAARKSVGARLAEAGTPTTGEGSSFVLYSGNPKTSTNLKRSFEKTLRVPVTVVENLDISPAPLPQQGALSVFRNAMSIALNNRLDALIATDGQPVKDKAYIATNEMVLYVRKQDVQAKKQPTVFYTPEALTPEERVVMTPITFLSAMLERNGERVWDDQEAFDLERPDRSNTDDIAKRLLSEAEIQPGGRARAVNLVIKIRRVFETIGKFLLRDIDRELASTRRAINFIIDVITARSMRVAILRGSVRSSFESRAKEFGGKAAWSQITREMQAHTLPSKWNWQSGSLYLQTMFASKPDMVLPPAKYLAISEVWGQFVRDNDELIGKGNRWVAEANGADLSPEAVRQLRFLIKRMHFSGAMEDLIRTRLAGLPGPYIVRSSHRVEDSYERNLAGYLISLKAADADQAVEMVKAILEDTLLKTWIGPERREGFPRTVDEENGLGFEINTYVDGVEKGGVCNAPTHTGGDGWIDVELGLRAENVVQAKIDAKVVMYMDDRRSTPEGGDAIVYPIGKANQATPETDFIAPVEKKALRSAANYFYSIMGPVDLEFTFKEGKLYAFQVRPYLSASPGNPIKMAPSVEALPVLSQTPLVKGVTSLEGFAGKIVVFTGNSSNDNLAQMQSYEASMGDNPKPYIGVFADAGTVALSYEGSLCRMFVDPTLESTNAHNVQMLHDKIAKGDGSSGILYANGNAVEKLAEFYKFESRGGVYVSDGEVTYFSNGVKGSFRALDRSPIAASDRLDLAKVCKAGTPISEVPAEKSAPKSKNVLPAVSGPVVVAMVDDYADAVTSLKMLIGFLPSLENKIRTIKYTSVEQALAGFAKDSPEIIMTDYALPGNRVDEYWSEIKRRASEGGARVILTTGYGGDDLPPAMTGLLKALNVPDEQIMLKPVELTEIERLLLKLHAELRPQIVAPIRPTGGVLIVSDNASEIAQLSAYLSIEENIAPVQTAASKEMAEAVKEIKPRVVIVSGVSAAAAKNAKSAEAPDFHVLSIGADAGATAQVSRHFDYSEITAFVKRELGENIEAGARLAALRNTESEKADRVDKVLKDMLGDIGGSDGRAIRQIIQLFLDTLQYYSVNGVGRANTNGRPSANLLRDYVATAWRLQKAKPGEFEWPVVMPNAAGDVRIATRIAAAIRSGEITQQGDPYTSDKVLLDHLNIYLQRLAYAWEIHRLLQAAPKYIARSSASDKNSTINFSINGTRYDLTFPRKGLYSASLSVEASQEPSGILERFGRLFTSTKKRKLSAAVIAGQTITFYDDWQAMHVQIDLTNGEAPIYRFGQSGARLAQSLEEEVNDLNRRIAALNTELGITTLNWIAISGSPLQGRILDQRSRLIRAKEALQAQLAEKNRDLETENANRKLGIVSGNVASTAQSLANVRATNAAARQGLENLAALAKARQTDARTAPSRKPTLNLRPILGLPGRKMGSVATTAPIAIRTAPIAPPGFRIPVVESNSADVFVPTRAPVLYASFASTFAVALMAGLAMPSVVRFAMFAGVAVFAGVYFSLAALVGKKDASFERSQINDLLQRAGFTPRSSGARLAMSFEKFTPGQIVTVSDNQRKMLKLSWKGAAGDDRVFFVHLFPVIAADILFVTAGTAPEMAEKDVDRHQGSKSYTVKGGAEIIISGKNFGIPDWPKGYEIKLLAFPTSDKKIILKLGRAEGEEKVAVGESDAPDDILKPSAPVALVKSDWTVLKGVSESLSKFKKLEKDKFEKTDLNNEVVIIQAGGHYFGVFKKDGKIWIEELKNLFDGWAGLGNAVEIPALPNSIVVGRLGEGIALKMPAGNAIFFGAPQKDRGQVSKKHFMLQIAADGDILYADAGSMNGTSFVRLPKPKDMILRAPEEKADLGLEHGLDMEFESAPIISPLLSMVPPARKEGSQASIIELEPLSDPKGALTFGQNGNMLIELKDVALTHGEELAIELPVQGLEGKRLEEYAAANANKREIITFDFDEANLNDPLTVLVKRARAIKTSGLSDLDKMLEIYVMASNALGGTRQASRKEFINRFGDKILRNLQVADNDSFSAISDQVDLIKLGKAGKRMSIGEFVKAQAGVCRHRAFLFHVLAQEAGLTTSLISGKVSIGGRHAWNEVIIGNDVYRLDLFAEPFIQKVTKNSRAEMMSILYRRDDASVYGRSIVHAGDRQVRATVNPFMTKIREGVGGRIFVVVQRKDDQEDYTGPALGEVVEGNLNQRMDLKLLEGRVQGFSRKFEIGRFKFEQGKLAREEAAGARLATNALDIMPEGFNDAVAKAVAGEAASELRKFEASAKSALSQADIDFQKLISITSQEGNLYRYIIGLADPSQSLERRAMANTLKNGAPLAKSDVINSVIFRINGEAQLSEMGFPEEEILKGISEAMKSVDAIATRLEQYATGEVQSRAFVMEFEKGVQKPAVDLFGEALPAATSGARLQATTPLNLQSLWTPDLTSVFEQMAAKTGKPLVRIDLSGSFIDMIGEFEDSIRAMPGDQMALVFMTRNFPDGRTEYSIFCDTASALMNRMGEISVFRLPVDAFQFNFQAMYYPKKNHFEIRSISVGGPADNGGIRGRGLVSPFFESLANQLSLSYGNAEVSAVAIELRQNGKFAVVPHLMEKYFSARRLSMAEARAYESFLRIDWRDKENLFVGHTPTPAGARLAKDLIPAVKEKVSDSSVEKRVRSQNLRETVEDRLVNVPIEHREALEALQDDVDGFMRYLSQFDAPMKPLHAEFRDAIAVETGHAPYSIIFVGKQNEWIWDLFGGRKNFSGAHYNLSDSSGRARDVELIWNDTRLPGQETISKIAKTDERLAGRTERAELAADLRVLGVLAHEAAHGQQGLRALALYRTPLFGVIAEGYQETRETEIITALAKRGDATGVKIMALINRLEDLEAELASTLDLYEAVMTMGSQPGWKDKPLSTRVDYLLGYYKIAYPNERRFVKALIGFVGEDIVREIYSSGSAESVERFSQALGPQRLNALLRAFNMLANKSAVDPLIAELLPKLLYAVLTRVALDARLEFDEDKLVSFILMFDLVFGIGGVFDVYGTDSEMTEFFKIINSGLDSDLFEAIIAKVSDGVKNATADNDAVVNAAEELENMLLDAEEQYRRKGQVWAHFDLQFDSSPEEVGPDKSKAPEDDESMLDGFFKFLKNDLEGGDEGDRDGEASRGFRAAGARLAAQIPAAAPDTNVVRDLVMERGGPDITIFDRIDADFVRRPSAGTLDVIRRPDTAGIAPKAALSDAFLNITQNNIRKNAKVRVDKQNGRMILTLAPHAVSDFAVDGQRKGRIRFPYVPPGSQADVKAKDGKRYRLSAIDAGDGLTKMTIRALDTAEGESRFSATIKGKTVSTNQFFFYYATEKVEIAKAPGVTLPTVKKTIEVKPETYRLTEDESIASFSAMFGKLLQTPLKKISDADPATVNLLALYYAKQKKQAGEFPVAFSAGLAGVKFAERDGGRTFVELADIDGEPIGEIELTKDLEKLQSSGIVVEKAALQSGATVEARAEEAATYARDFARIHRQTLRAIGEMGEKLTASQPLILKITVGTQTGEAQKTLLAGSRSIISGLFKDVAVEYVTADGKRAEGFESDSRVEDFAKQGAPVSYIADIDAIETVKADTAASAVFLEKADSGDLFAYTAIMVAAIMVKRLNFQDLGDRGTQLLDTLIGGGIHISRKEFDAMKSPSSQSTAFDFKSITFKKLGRIPVDQIMQGARMALSAIGASA